MTDLEASGTGGAATTKAPAAVPLDELADCGSNGAAELEVVEEAAFFSTGSFLSMSKFRFN